MQVIKEFSYFNTLLRKIAMGIKINIPRINLFGSRKSAKTTSAILFMIRAALLKKCAVYAFRYFKRQDTMELYKQFVLILGLLGIKEEVELNQTAKTIKFKNGSFIQVQGLHTTQNDDIKMTGIASAMGYDFTIMFAEERFEISDKEWSAVTSAVRGDINTQRIEIHASNPWNFDLDYVKYCHNTLPFNLEELKTKGSQFLFKDNEIFHYTNYLVNDMLSQEDIDGLHKDAMFNPSSADTIVYGYPGAVDGGIWTLYLDQMFKEYDESKSVDFIGGVDYGEAVDGDPTAAVLVGLNARQNHAHVHDEYFWWNKARGEKKTLNTIADDVLDFYASYYNKLELSGRMYIYVDNANTGFINTLREKAQEAGWGKDIWFTQSTKKKIADRVDAIKTMAALGMFSVSDKCKHLIREYQAQTYSKVASKYRDGPDHGTDATEYAVAGKWVELIRNMNKLKEAYNG